MKEIDIYNDFKQKNLGSNLRVNQVVERIQLNGESDITLNLSKCFIDYPYTAKIIDKVLEQLNQTQEENKIFNIKYDLKSSESTVLNALFNGSNFLKLVEERSYTSQEIKTALKDEFEKYNINSELITIDIHGKELTKMKLC